MENSVDTTTNTDKETMIKQRETMEENMKEKPQITMKNWKTE